jgi:hypothetical protein
MSSFSFLAVSMYQSICSGESAVALSLRRDKALASAPASSVKI